MLTIISCSDELDNVVQVGEGRQESLYQMQPLLSLGQVEACPPLNHIAPAAAPCMHHTKIFLSLTAVQSKLDVEQMVSPVTGWSYLLADSHVSCYASVCSQRCIEVKGLQVAWRTAGLNPKSSTQQGLMTTTGQKAWRMFDNMSMSSRCS